MEFGVVKYPSLTGALKSQLKKTLRICSVLGNSRLSLMNFKKREVIVVFFKNGHHGGLVDRLKNIISAAAVAKSTKSDLIIIHQTPFQLTEFFDIRVKYLKNINQLKINPFILNLVRNKEHGEEILEKRLFNKYRRKKHFQLVLDTNQQIPKQDDTWRKIFYSTLNIKGELIKQFSQQFSVTIVHIRFFSLLGDFKDTPLTRINEESKKLLIEACLNRVGEKLNLHQDLLLISDSNKFVELAKNKYPQLKTTPGIAKHIDLNEDSDFTKEIMDFYCLLNAKNIINIAGSPLFASNFSRFGGLIGASNFERINAWTGESMVVEDFSQNKLTS